VFVYVNWEGFPPDPLKSCPEKGGQPLKQTARVVTMRRRKTERLISFLAAIWLVLACVPARSQPEGSRPVKIVVESADLTVHAGERVELAVGLQDAVGRTAEAPKPLLVELEVRSHSGRPSP
jgi:hypothetical protein